MIENLMLIFPRRIGAAGLTAALGAAALGCALGIFGARFSRQLIALCATAGGGAIGFQSPHWFGWTIDPWAVAVLGSLILGAIGYQFHRWLAALALGASLALWTAVGAFAHADIPNRWLAAILPTDIVWSQLADAPNKISNETAAILVIIMMLALAGGTALAIRWPRLGISLLWTVVGLTITVPALLTAAQEFEPRSLELLPSRPQTEALSLATLVAVGIAVQWRLAFYKRSMRKAA